MYQTTVPYAAVLAVTSGREPVAELVVPGRLEEGKPRLRVRQRVRAHARRYGVRAHAVLTRFDAGPDGSPVTVFTVLPGPGRRLIGPELRAQVIVACRVQGLTTRQAAVRFGISQSAVWAIISRG
jgi:hypothetical protein